MKEDELIQVIKNLLPESAEYIGSDTAYIPDKDLILTQDTLVEDVHFRKSTISPFDLGRKAIAVNLSDIAAAGGIPKYMLISLSLPERIEKEFIQEFYEGIRSICRENNTIVVGGDLTKADKIVISITAIGASEGAGPAKRSSAKPGDFVIVTGEFGASGVGLWMLESKLKLPGLLNDIPKSMYNKFVDSHINPVPKLEEGRSIVKTCNKPPALMDASDGLADALYKICFESNVSMEIDYNNIPKDEYLNFIAEKTLSSTFDWIFYGGEDYELVGTVPKDCLDKLIDNEVPIKIIGKVIPVENKPVVYVNYNNDIIEINSQSFGEKGFSHFK